MLGFDHFITTWFNVRFPGHSRGLDPNWLDHRFRLFERFCLPSVQAQTAQDFTWIVFFDPGTPEPYRSRIEQISEWPNFKPIFLDEWTFERMREVIAASRSPDRGFLITTRLDNDDALSRDHIQLVQQQFAQQDSEFVNFPEGYVWDRGRLYSVRHWSNAFASLIERVAHPGSDGFQTVLSIPHMEIATSGRARQIEGRTGWLQLVHSENIENRRMGIRQPVRRVTEQFAIDPRELPQRESSIERGLDWVRSLALLKARAALWRLRHGHRGKRMIEG